MLLMQLSTSHWGHKRESLCPSTFSMWWEGCFVPLFQVVFPPMTVESESVVGITLGDSGMVIRYQMLKLLILC